MIKKLFYSLLFIGICITLSSLCVNAESNYNLTYNIDNQTTYVNQTITFVDTSMIENTNTVWNFGDNTALDYNKITSHTYNKSGLYTVSMRVYNDTLDASLTFKVTVLNEPSINHFNVDNANTPANNNIYYFFSMGYFVFLYLGMWIFVLIQKNVLYDFIFMIINVVLLLDCVSNPYSGQYDAILLIIFILVIFYKLVQDRTKKEV
jgi:hypothetical protein